MNPINEIRIAIRRIIRESLEEKNDCYPSDYQPGKTYGRETLSKIFSCMTGRPNDFPVLAIKEMMFPLEPGGGFTDKDPKAFTIYSDEPITMEEMVEKEMGRISKFKTATIQINEDSLHPETLLFIKNKRNAPGYEKRVEFQKKKVRSNGMNSLVITPKEEPVVFTLKNGKYSLEEGWHRTLALLDMLNDGEFDADTVPVNAIIAIAK